MLLQSADGLVIAQPELGRHLLHGSRLAAEAACARERGEYSGEVRGRIRNRLIAEYAACFNALPGGSVCGGFVAPGLAAFPIQGNTGGQARQRVTA